MVQGLPACAGGPLPKPATPFPTDWEHITVRCHPHTGDLQGVYYNRHFNKEGQWVAAADVPRDPVTGRIVAYVAIGGHGVYDKVRRPAEARKGWARNLRACKEPEWEALEVL